MLHSYIYIATYLPRAAPFFHWKRDDTAGTSLRAFQSARSVTLQSRQRCMRTSLLKVAAAPATEKKFNKIAAILLSGDILHLDKHCVCAAKKYLIHPHPLNIYTSLLTPRYTSFAFQPRHHDRLSSPHECSSDATAVKRAAMTRSKNWKNLVMPSSRARSAVELHAALALVMAAPVLLGI